MKSFNLHLYLVTDEAAKCRHSLLETVRKAVDGGVTIVQYRSTNPDAGTCYREALPIRDFLAARGIPFIVNNRVDLALALDADGVHIGQRDLPVPSVRAMIGPDKILGLSVSNMDQLRAVDASLVDYLGMGPVFPTISKLNAPPVLGVEGFAALASRSPLPVVAIGGLDAERARQVRATGTAAGIAAVSAICGAEDRKPPHGRWPDCLPGNAGKKPFFQTPCLHHPALSAPSPQIWKKSGRRPRWFSP
ncbi:MAG: thiamine phosphate synthase [Akkermansia sp.]|uniref:thiamine phosphate synthase n=2 Tax=Akkermansia sp. TaxID=1872421 RepID=UPI003990C57E